MVQQTIDVGEAPNDGTGDPLRDSFVKVNANFTEVYRGAGGNSEGLWNYNQTSTDTTTSPVTGRFRTNSGNYLDATQIAIHGTSIQGIDRSNTLRTLLVGDLIQCQDSLNGNAWCRYRLEAPPVDNGAWFQLNVALEDSGSVASGDNQEIIFIFTANSGASVDLSDYAPINSPIFTGNPTAPTPPLGDNDTSIATTAFVTTAVAASSAIPGWVPADAVIHIDLLGGSPQGRAWVDGTGEVAVSTLIGNDPVMDAVWQPTGYDEDDLTADGLVRSALTPALVGEALVRVLDAATVVIRIKQVSGGATPSNPDFIMLSADAVDAIDYVLSRPNARGIATTYGGGSLALQTATTMNIGDGSINGMACTVTAARFDIAVSGSPGVAGVLDSLDRPAGNPLTAVLIDTNATGHYAIQSITIYDPLPSIAGLSELSDAGGNVSNSGTPTVGQWARWVTATTIEGVAAASTGFVQKTGDTMTGKLTAAVPAAGGENIILSGSGSVGIHWTPSTGATTTAWAYQSGNTFGIGNDATDIISVNLASEVASLNATPALGDSSTKIATTAFVQTAVAGLSPPPGRLTLATATPVMTTTQAAKTTIFYTPYTGNKLPIYDGTNLVMTTFAELSAATTDTTKSPAAIGASKVNDWFVWNDAGTIRLGHGPDWTNDTTRSAGTALVRVNGIWLNNAAITNGPAAQRGTYVGTTRSNASSQLDWIFGSSAAGGGMGSLYVWNAYNRVDVVSTVKNSNTSYTVASAAFINANSSATYRTNYVMGLAEDFVRSTYYVHIVGNGTNSGRCSVGYDSATLVGISGENSGSAAISVLGTYQTTSLGAHYMTAIEQTGGGASLLFYGVGTSGGLDVAGLVTELRM